MVNKIDLISIIIPIYNAEENLSRCINSVCNQTYKNIQIILVDDGSTDYSGNICDTFAKKDERIEVYHISNVGSVKARKIGLFYAKGDYIGFVDADDYIESEMYESMLSVMKQSEAGLIQCGYVCEKGNDFDVWDYGKTGIYDIHGDKTGLLADCLFLHNSDEIVITNTIWSKLFKSNLIKQCFNKVPDEQQYGEDLLCVCMCLLECNTIAIVQNVYYHYIIRDDSLSHKYDLSILENEMNLYVKIKFLLEKYGYYDKVRESLLAHFKNNLAFIITKINSQTFNLKNYMFPNIKKLFNQKIVIYAAGKVGIQYYKQICKYQQCEVVAIVDISPQNYHYEFVEVIHSNKVKDLEFDILLIAVKDRVLADNIRQELINEGVLEDKILWESPVLTELNI